MSGANLDLFDAREGRRRRDTGMARVESRGDPEWGAQFRALADRFLDALPLGGEFSGETLRLYCKTNSLPDPHHPNAWGAAARAVLSRWRKSGRVSVVGLAQAHDPRSHACSMPRYRRDA